jgi:hypothetical protein
MLFQSWYHSVNDLNFAQTYLIWSKHRKHKNLLVNLTYFYFDAVKDNNLLVVFLFSKPFLFPQFASFIKLCSNMHNAILLWGCANKKSLDKIGNLQKKGLRNVSFKSYKAHTEPILKIWTFLNWEINLHTVDPYLCTNIKTKSSQHLSQILIQT